MNVILEELSSCDLLCAALVFRMAEGLFARKSVGLAGAAVFSSLAALSTLVIPARIQPAFPPLPFLLFDPAEIFAVLAFLIFGPIPAFIVATVHWIFLTATGSGTPLGPVAKFTAVVATLIGLWIGSRIYGRLAFRYQSIWVAIACMFVFGMFVRIGITLVVNYYIFTFIGPVVFGIDYLGFGQATLQTTLKLKFVGSGDILVAMLLYTSIFNILQAFIAITIPYFIFTPLSVKIPEIASGNPWISKFAKHQA
jgi:riboflavin transporter FmnP